MTDTITRWECQECGGHDGGHRYADDEQPFCPGVPVERTYVAVDLVEGALSAIRFHGEDPRFPCHAICDADCIDTMRETAGAALAAINAVTGERP